MMASRASTVLQSNGSSSKRLPTEQAQWRRMLFSPPIPYKSSWPSLTTASSGGAKTSPSAVRLRTQDYSKLLRPRAASSGLYLDLMQVTTSLATLAISDLLWQETQALEETPATYLKELEWSDLAQDKMLCQALLGSETLTDSFTNRTQSRSSVSVPLTRPPTLMRQLLLPHSSRKQRAALSTTTIKTLSWHLLALY